MINTSSEFKKAVKGSRDFRVNDTIILNDGTELSVTAEKLLKYEINEATSASGKFEIGAAVIKKYTITLDNMDQRYDTYDFEDAVIRTNIGLRLQDGTYENMSKGTYRVYKATFGEATLQIEAYDEMLFFSKPYSESRLTYPAVLREIIQSACRDCGVACDTSTIEMSAYRVEEKPEGSITYRDVISYCAQIMGCYARIDHNGRLTFGWYDFPDVSQETEENTDYQHFSNMYSQTINASDVSVTGINVTVQVDSKEESYLYGTDEYVLEIKDNPLISSRNMDSVAKHIGDKVIGKPFRPLNISVLSDPSIESGDAAIVTTRKGTSYGTVITETTFKLSGSQSIACTAETPTEKTFTRYNAATKLMERARRETDIAISDYDLAVLQMNQLSANTFGFSFTSVKQEDGSYLFYRHDKPKLAESKTVYKSGLDGFFVTQDYTGDDSTTTWKAGFDSNGNAVLNQLAVIGIHWDWASGGALTLGGKGNGNGILYLHDSADGLKMELSNGGQFFYKEDGKVAAVAAENETIWMRNPKTIPDTWRTFDVVSFSKDGMVEKKGRLRRNPDNTIEWEEDDAFVEITDEDGTVTEGPASSYPPPLYKNKKNHWFGNMRGLNVDDTISAKNESFTNSPNITNMSQATDGAAVAWNGAKLLKRVSSSRRYKDVGRAVSEADMEDWYNIQPVWAKYKDGYLDEKDSRYGKEYPMFVAEDVAENFPLAADYLQDGRPETWNERVIIPAMFAMIRQQHEEIEKIKKMLRGGAE